MAHLQYMPGDPRLVDQLVYELKSKGIFDQFRKDCIADVDTRPAYQNLRQRVESSVAAFLSRQIWKPDLNKNQLREKLRKHLLDGNYLEQGVERIVDQVVNPKVASVFIPQVEDLVYNYLGIPRKKSTANAEATEGKSSEDLLPTDLEAVSPGSVKSNCEKNDAMDVSTSKEETKMDIEEKSNAEIKEDSIIDVVDNSNTANDSKMSVIEVNQDSQSSIDKNTTTIPLPAEEIKLENIPAPENSPPNIKDKKIDLEKIDLPKEPNLSTDIPLPDEIPKMERNSYFQPMSLASEDDSSSDSSLQRNMSPLTPIRNYNNENSCDAQQGFDNDSDSKNEVKKEPTTFRFAIENKSPEKSPEPLKVENKEPEQDLSYQFTNQVNINNFNTPMYDDSSNSNNLHIDYESDVNSKLADIKPPETEQNSVDSKKEKKSEERKSSSHKSSHRSRDSHRHSSSSKDKRSESKHSSSRDSHRHDKKSSKDDKTKSTSNKDKTSEKGDKNNEKAEKPSEKTEKKDSKEKDRDSSKHRNSSHKSSRDKDSKHRSSSSSKHSSSRHDDKKSSSTSKDKVSDKSKDSKDKSRDRSSSHRSDKDKDRKSSSKSKSDEKENKEKKEKKETDDHYSLSGRGNPNRRSTDRDSNDGSTSSKGSHNPSTTKSSTSKKETKSSSKSENTASDNSSSPSDKDVNAKEHKVNNTSQKVVRVDTHLEVPIQSPPRLPFVPDVTLKKPRFAANLAEAKKMMKMRKFLEEEQKRMNQEAALLLEFQANVRPSLSQVYSSIPGPELEFACVPNTVEPAQNETVTIENASMDKKPESKGEQLSEVNIQQNITEVTVDDQKDAIAETLIAMHLEHNVHNKESELPSIEQSHHDIIQTLTDDDDDDDDVKSEIDRENDVRITDGTVKVDNEESNMETEEYFEVTVIVAEPENDENKAKSGDIDEYDHFIPEQTELHYFAEPEKYVAELEKDRFSRFLKSYTEKIPSKIYVINCDSYEENLIKEVSNNFGNFEIVNYHKNGHLKMPAKNKNVIKNVNLHTEIIIPPKLNENTFTINEIDTEMTSGIFSPVKSESSFELHSDYDAKLEEMVNKTSRQQIMEIILGNVDESPSKMPSIEYCMESSIESAGNNLKRKYNDVDTNVNNNITVLTSNKIRKLSDSDQISSTTEETEETPNDVSFQNNKKSKYLGKARRVGLPKPKRTLPNPNSPSSDQSVENYSTNLRESPKKVKPPRNKVQRYDTSDLYKPKLHFLSRRNFTLNE